MERSGIGGKRSGGRREEVERTSDGTAVDGWMELSRVGRGAGRDEEIHRSMQV